jgi:co-chaperonin GroES (HSP10)
MKQNSTFTPFAMGYKGSMKNKMLGGFILALALAAGCAGLWAQAGAPLAAGAVKQLGAIRTITGPVLMLATDQGAEVTVKVQQGARIFRLAPGQTDLKGATAIQLGDLQVGDRVLVRGKMDDDGASLDATTVIVMKQQDIAQRKQQEMLDWQRRGVGGLVKEVNLQAGTISISVNGAGGSKTVAIATTPKTICKRYAPDSVKWEDASPARVEDIHVGDQLRARGDKNPDGTQLAAEEIVAGTFRNIAGLVTAVDSAQSTLTVEDLMTKKPVTVRITADSQMKELPAQLAQGLAMRLKGGAAHDAAPEGAPAAPPAAGTRTRNADLNQMLTRLPAAALGDLHKGEAVMIVSTMGSAGQLPAAVTLLGGVEPILTAAPTGRGTESLLTPWSLAGAPGGDQQ